MMISSMSTWGGRVATQTMASATSSAVKRVHAVVGGFGALGVALETDDGEFGLGQPGIDRADAHAGAGEFEAQGAGDLEFRRPWPRNRRRRLLVGDMPGDGANVDDRAAGIFHERAAGRRASCAARRARLSAASFPSRSSLPVADGVQAVRAAGVIDQDVNDPVLAARQAAKESTLDFGASRP